MYIFTVINLLTTLMSKLVQLKSHKLMSFLKAESFIS